MDAMRDRLIEMFRPIIASHRELGASPESLVRACKRLCLVFDDCEDTPYDVLNTMAHDVSEGWWGIEASDDLYHARDGSRAYQGRKYAAVLLWDERRVVNERSFWPTGWGKGEYADVDPRTIAGP